MMNIFQKDKSFTSTSSTKNDLEIFYKEFVKGTPEHFPIQIRFYGILVSTLSGVIIIFNLLVVLSSGLILHKKQRPRSTYLFLGNISLADMVTGLVMLLGQCFKDKISELFCYILMGTSLSAILASIYTIGLIAIDRYLYILHGLKYQLHMTTRRARFMVLGTWILGLIIGFLPVMGIRNPTNGEFICSVLTIEPTALLLATSFIGILPLVLIFILYCLILKIALNKIQEQQISTLPLGNATDLRYFRGGNQNNYFQIDISGIGVVIQDELQTCRSIVCCFRRTSSLQISTIDNPNRCRAIKIITLTTGCYFITWVPYFVGSILYTNCNNNHNLSDYCNNLSLVLVYLGVLGISNSLMNPFIYAWWHKGFRNEVKKFGWKNLKKIIFKK